MKTPLLIWANTIRRHMKENKEPITPNSLMSHMIAEDSKEVQDFYFEGLLPTDVEKIAYIQKRLDTIDYISRVAVLN